MEYMFNENSSLHKELTKYYQGARDMMEFMHDYYDGKEPIYPSEMEDIFIKFVEQRCTVKVMEQKCRLIEVKRW